MLNAFYELIGSLSRLLTPAPMTTGYWIVAIILSCAVILYAYAGYPLLVSLALRFNRQVEIVPALPSDSDCPSVCVLITAFNESGSIENKIDSCLAQEYPAEKLRVLVVSDGSTDDTVRVVRDYPDARVSVLDRSERTGKAACLNAGMSHISESVVVLTDVRQMLAPESVRALASHFSEPSVGVVTGQLQLIDSRGEWFGRGVGAYWDHETRLRRMEASVHSVVGATGALYALRRVAFQPIPDRTILDDVLIPMNTVLAGYRVLFEARAKAFDEPSQQVETERHRKIRTLAGNFQLVALRPMLLHPSKNPIFLQFVSHKFIRLLVPLAMLATFVATVLLSTFHWIFALMVVAQVCGYILAMLPESIGAIGPLSKIRTFILMHWFVVLGFVEFVGNKDAHMWKVTSQTVDGSD